MVAGFGVRNSNFLRLLTILLCLQFASNSALAAELEHKNFAGLKLVDVLALFADQGVQILYSTDVVSQNLTLPQVPVGDPLARLSAGLDALGLELRDIGMGRFVIARQAGDVRRIIRGTVVDAQSGIALAGVRIELNGQLLQTDAQGRFRIELRGDYPVLVSHAGYEDKLVDPEVAELLEIGLTRSVPMDEIVVVSSRYNVDSNKTRVHGLDLTYLETAPSLGEDPLRVTSHLPGMATIGVSAKPHIRGGLQDELLVLFNDLELLEPFHLRDFQSVFSSFNPSLVQSIDVYTGGFPARYGDRMSGVMDIQSRVGHTRTGGELSISLLNTSALLHGGISDGRGEWVVSGRRGNLDIVTKQVNSTVGDPGYSDWFGQVRYQLDPLTEIDVGVIAYDDDISLRDFDLDGEVANSGYNNIYTWAQLHRQWSPRLDSSSLFYAGRIAHSRTGLLTDLELSDGTARVDDDREFQLWSLAQRFALRYSDSVFAEFGIQYTRYQAQYDYFARIERGLLADFLGNGLDEVRQYRLRPGGGSGGVFGSLRAEILPRVTVEGGLRWGFQDYAARRDSQLSPRLSAKFDVHSNTEIRISAGRFYQPEAIHELQIADGQTTYQDAQYADHYIVGWHQQFGESGFSLRVEGFSKEFRNPKRRFENLFNPLVLLPELASDRVEIKPRRANAQGVEATLRYTRDNLLTWLTFSQSRARDLVASGWQSRAWDQGQSLSMGASWQNERWSLGMNLLWHDGWKTTRLPAAIDVDESPTVNTYGTRLRDYIVLDVQLQRTWAWQHQSLTAFLEVTNMLGRSNVGGIEYDVELNGDESQYIVTPTKETLLPLVPSIGLRWRF
jgi:hypothetical protein